MKQLILILFAFLAINVKSQDVMVLSGAVAEDSTGAPVEFAAVVLKTTDSVYVANTLTDEKGKFTFSKVASGKFFIEVSFLGFIKYYSAVFEFKASKVLPIMKLKKNNTDLQEVNITAIKNAVEFKPGKTVYNVSRDPTNTGLNGLEVLRKIPGVFIDNNDNITVRGKSGIRVYVDDRPTAMAAESPADAIKFFPAGSIESIEVITNPGAKYDAAGSGAIINIKLKKEKKMGFNGSANLSTGSRYEFSGIDKCNAGLTLNIRRNKTNVFVNANSMVGEREFYNENNRESTGGQLLRSVSKGTNSMANGFVKAGLDYFISDKNTLGISYMVGSGSFATHTNSNSVIKPQSPFIPASYTGSKSNGNMLSHTINVNDVIKTKHAGEELSFDITYNVYQRKNIDSILTGLEFPNLPLSNQNQYSKLASGAISNTAQLDYSRTLRGNAKIEAGLKNTFTTNNSKFNFFNSEQNAWLFDSIRSNKFDYYENVSALYLQYSNKFKKWEYVLGLRGENTNVSSNLSDVKQKYFNVFPDLELSKRFEENFSFSISYSSRIDRVPFSMLSNEVSYSDRYIGNRGNPKLLPEISNNVSIDLEKQFDSNKDFKIGGAGASFYGSLAKNATGYAIVVDTSSVSYTTFVNIPHTYSGGGDVYAQLSYKRWYNATVSLAVNYNYFNATNKGEVHTIYAQNNFKFLKKHSININGFYFSKFITSQGYVKGNYQINAGYKFIFLKENASLTFNVNDIFKTGSMHYYVTAQDYKMSGLFQFETRVATLGFQYKFSKGWQGDGKKRTKKNNKDNRLEYNNNNGGGLGTGK